MPTHEIATFSAPPPIEPHLPDVSYTRPLTPPPEIDESEMKGEQELPERSHPDDGIVDNAEVDNTASGMSIAQERSMYEPASPASTQNFGLGLQTPKEPEMDKPTLPHDYLILRNDVPITPIKSTPLNESDEPDASDDILPSPRSIIDEPTKAEDIENHQSAAHEAGEGEGETSKIASPARASRQVEPLSSYPQGTHITSTEPAFTSPTRPWDFSCVRLKPNYPSSLLRPGSKFTGTQQSDRQIYNVSVCILTLSVPQSNLTGYLRIEGLTEDHPSLTTFFTGEIIGGPSQKYTFQTKHPDWGANDKVDLQHWARFPAWRPLAKEAKRDLNFAYPPTPTGLGEGGKPAAPASCWQKENIFMRWKESFLVPDHRVTSIQGASFEGFYYICFNQVEGRINGIYFHARSEKYQQLVLKHVFDKGVCGAFEFR